MSSCVNPARGYLLALSEIGESGGWNDILDIIIT
jgi:hypothetical protein